MQAVGTRYTGVLNAVASIYKADGFPGFYKGVVPTTQRAALLTASQLASYDHIKQALRRSGFGEGIALHFMSSFIAVRGHRCVCCFADNNVGIYRCGSDVTSGRGQDEGDESST